MDGILVLSVRKVLFVGSYGHDSFHFQHLHATPYPIIASAKCLHVAWVIITYYLVLSFSFSPQSTFRIQVHSFCRQIFISFALYFFGGGLVDHGQIYVVVWLTLTVNFKDLNLWHCTNQMGLHCHLWQTVLCACAWTFGPI